MSWRLARSLITFRDQFNARFPKRNKGSDGGIGDQRHQSRSSDHNAWIRDAGQGVVSAYDITHDPKNGLDVHAIAEVIRQKRDPRLKYCITNRRIFSGSSGPQPWQYRRYNGSNPHSSHFHISVKSTKAHYDDPKPWELFSGPPTSIPDTENDVIGDPDSPALRPVLRRGAKGDDVKTLQKLLGMKSDGHFGPQTEAAVKGFQRAEGLQTDGIVGFRTWSALDSLEEIPTDGEWQRNIIATVFGGRADPNQSAYEPRQIDDDEFGVALPYRFPIGERPQIEVVNVENGKSVVCDVVDVGPWNTADRYWQTGSRPQAESGKDTRGRTTNRAGIDLTPGAAREIALKGKGVVHWAFATDKDEGGD